MNQCTLQLQNFICINQYRTVAVCSYGTGIMYLIL
jgi:hypothetical protein